MQNGDEGESVVCAAWLGGGKSDEGDGNDIKRCIEVILEVSNGLIKRGGQLLLLFALFVTSPCEL